jgi:DNA-directed RNA polymerase specialized sigma24 family protein
VSDDLLRSQDWGRVRAQILAYAMKRARSKAKAQDLAQEAMMRALDARWNPWDPEKHPDIVDFLISIVNRLLANENQKRKVHREISMDRELRGETGREGDGDLAGATLRKALAGGDDGDAGKARKNPLADPAATPEAAAGDRELYRRRVARLRERLARDRVALDAIDQTELEVDLPEEQAAATGHALHEIETARRRIAFHAKKVAREIPALPPDPNDEVDHDEASTDDEA